MAADRNGLSDPYVSVIVGEEKHKTTIKSKTLNPVWNETLQFTLNQTSKHILVKVKDHDDWSKSDELGDITIAIKDIREAGGRIRKKWTLQNTKHGILEMEIVFMGTSPLSSHSFDISNDKEIKEHTPQTQQT